MSARDRMDTLVTVGVDVQGAPAGAPPDLPECLRAAMRGDAQREDDGHTFEKIARGTRVCVACGFVVDHRRRDRK